MNNDVIEGEGFGYVAQWQASGNRTVACHRQERRVAREHTRREVVIILVRGGVRVIGRREFTGMSRGSASAWTKGNQE